MGRDRIFSTLVHRNDVRMERLKFLSIGNGWRFLDWFFQIKRLAIDLRSFGHGDLAESVEISVNNIV